MREDGACYAKDGSGPYCPNCYNNRKEINLMSVPVGTFPPKCPVCKHNMKRR